MEEKDATQKALELAIAAEDIRRRATRYIEVGGKRYKLRTMTTYLSERLTALSYDALLYEREIKKEDTKPSRAKRLMKKMRRIPSKMAAISLLGRLWYIPFLYAIVWRKLHHSSEEVSAAINTAAVQGGDANFSSANWDIIKYRLVLSIRPVGEGIKKMLQRMESAENMVEQADTTNQDKK